MEHVQFHDTGNGVEAWTEHPAGGLIAVFAVTATAAWSSLAVIYRECTRDSYSLLGCDGTQCRKCRRVMSP